MLKSQDLYVLLALLSRGDSSAGYAAQTGLAVSAVHGAKYAFAPVWGPLTRGVPTAYGATPLNSVIKPSGDPVPKRPHAKGLVRGLSLAPLYPSVPDTTLKDARLYALLTLFDAVRSGQARERDAAKKLLAPYFQ